MLARDAENLFWTGRYLERAEDTARLLDVTYHGLLEATISEQRLAWRSVLDVVGLRHEFEQSGRRLTGTEVAEFLVCDLTNPGSVISAVGAARENARTVRESLSTDLWEAINDFCLSLRSRDLRGDLEHHPHELYGFVRRSCQAIAGVATETLRRDEGWYFLRLGWSLERAEWTCRLLRDRQIQLESAGFHEWVGTLRAASGLEAYRWTYRSSMDPADVVEFLLLSREFPRSVFYSVRTAEEALRFLDGATASIPVRVAGRLRAELEYAEVRELMSSGLDEQLVRVEDSILRLGGTVGAQYFINAHEFDMHSLQVLPGGRR